MKELSIEEKAKAYDEAKIRISKAYNDNRCTIGFMNEIFPELKESGNIRIIKAIKYGLDHVFTNNTTVFEVTKEQCLAWLEKQGEPKEINPSEFDSQLNRLLGQFKSLPKEELVSSLSFYLNIVQNDGTYKEENQGEQKPTEWSEKDEANLNDAIDACKAKYGNMSYTADWLKSLRPQNWTKEDKERYISCLQKLSTGNLEQPETINSKWFKEHVYPKIQWKPSEMQMTALRRVKNAVGGEGEIYGPLNSLYEDLKKLKD